jgi:hypothetical protein
VFYRKSINFLLLLTNVVFHYDYLRFLSKPTDVRDWNIQGLPKDDFSTENGVISTRGSRWPLMIDPQVGWYIINHIP